MTIAEYHVKLRLIWQKFMTISQFLTCISEKISTHYVLCAPPQMVQFSASIHLKNRSSSHKILLRSDQLPMLECLTWMIDSMQTPYRVQVFKKSLVSTARKKGWSSSSYFLFCLFFCDEIHSQNKLRHFMFFTGEKV